MTSRSDPAIEIQALCFSDSDAANFLITLAGTAFFDVGWSIVKEGDKSFVVSNRDYALLTKEKLVDKAKGKELPKARESLICTLSEHPLAHRTNSTVILCPGVKGRKQSVGTLRDMSAYLMQGMNVAVFAYRGTEKSKGAISEKGLMLDLETIVDTFLAERGVAEKDILVVGNCFGAGPAAALAARRDVNLLLVEPYANLQKFAKEQIRYQDPAPTFLPKKVKEAYFNWFGASYDIPTLLKDVRGHIGIVFNETDDQVGGQHDALTLEALPNSRPGQVIKGMFVAGMVHGAGWYTAPQDEVKGQRLRLKNPTVTPEDFVYLREEKPEKFVSLGEQQVGAFLRQAGLSQRSLLENL